MNSNLKRIIISPPFGTYLNFDWATSVKGTWTAFPRPGNRVLRAIRTMRHVEGGRAPGLCDRNRRAVFGAPVRGGGVRRDGYRHRMARRGGR